MSFAIASDPDFDSLDRKRNHYDEKTKEHTCKIERWEGWKRSEISVDKSANFRGMEK